MSQGKILIVNDDITKYQTKFQQLIQAKHQIVEQIRNISRKQRFLQLQPKSSDDIGQKPRKIVKKQTNQKKAELEKLEVHTQAIRDDIKKANQVNANIKDRNKRMFGGLTKYLNNAKSTLEKQQSDIKHKNVIQDQVVLKQKHHSEEIQSQKKKTLEEERELITNKKIENAKQLLKYQNLILQSKYTSYVNQLSSFIATKSKPIIMWKANKQSSITSKLHEQTKKNLQEQLNKKKAIIESYTEIFDLKKFLVENEQQYFTNKMNRYYALKGECIITKAKPQIFWKPTTFNQNLKQIRQQTRKNLIQEKNKLLGQFKAYLHQEEHAEHSESQHSNKQQSK